MKFTAGVLRDLLIVVFTVCLVVGVSKAVQKKRPIYLDANGNHVARLK